MSLHSHDKREVVGKRKKLYVLESLMTFLVVFEQGTPGGTYVEKMGINYMKIMQGISRVHGVYYENAQDFN